MIPFLQYLQPLIQFDHPVSIRKTIKEDRSFLLLVFVVGVVLFFIVSLGWPVGLGRDYYRYLNYFSVAMQSDILGNRVWITPPGISFIVGFVMKGGPLSVTLFLLTIYQVSIFGIYYVGRMFGKNMARGVTLFALGHVQFATFCHFFTSDPVLALFLAIWGIALVRFYQTHTLTSYAVIGFVSFLLVLIRPMSQLYIFTFLLPFVCFGFSKKNATLSGATLTFFVGGLVLLATYHLVMFGDFAVARGGKYVIPFRNTYLFSKIMSPDNGPASERLGKHVEELLQDPIYRENGITVKQFFESPTKIYFHDITDNYRDGDLFFKASLEAIKAHPEIFWQSVYKNVRYQFLRPFDLDPPPKPVTDPKGKQTIQDLQQPQNVQCKNFKCRPISRTVADDKRIKNQQNLSPFERRNQEKVSNYQNSILNLFPERQGNYWVAEFLRSLMYKYPSMWFFCSVSLLLILGINRREVRLLGFIIIPHFMASAISGSMADPIPNYRIPHDLFFILAGLTGMVLLLDRVIVGTRFFTRRIVSSS